MFEMFAHSWKDIWLVLLSVVHLALFFVVAFFFDALSWPWLVALGGLLVFLYCTNYQCVAHNFLHNPFFKWEWLNNAFSVMNSMVLGMPQTLYKYHHLNHHQFNNDVPEPPAMTQDRSSTFRHARTPGREETFCCTRCSAHFARTCTPCT